MDGRTLRHQHRKPELLAAVTEYVLDHGIGDVSLRPIALTLGITHATLLRHFSSKEELLLQVVGKIHSDFLVRLEHDEDLRAAKSTPEFLRTVWRRLCEPEEQRQFVLLFELVGRAAREPERTGNLVQSIVSDWLIPIEERLTRDGRSPGEVSVLATMVLAQIRGLQLDLLVTGDRARVDKAFDFTVELASRPSIR
ncbi:TetR/AcrR family transcriptional regulator [Rhodococcus pseudokoreensis]|uniref:TetR/AcrR family transcriptional regulator n=1 Tax=Rhodococcus pseudokoreensis TaxID=2811421 RepID=A0A974WCP8_9NOCA|nr:TetR/AcrR family transcriptional regulator [Rhodococcus pseudokoreensis]